MDALEVRDRALAELKRCDGDRRKYLVALSQIRVELVGHAVAAENVRRMIELIDEALE